MEILTPLKIFTDIWYKYFWKKRYINKDLIDEGLKSLKITNDLRIHIEMDYPKNTEIKSVKQPDIILNNLENLIKGVNNFENISEYEIDTINIKNIYKYFKRVSYTKELGPGGKSYSAGKLNGDEDGKKVLELQLYFKKLNDELLLINKRMKILIKA